MDWSGQAAEMGGGEAEGWEEAGGYEDLRFMA